MKIQQRFLEISQATNPNGRRNVKLVLHEIYTDNTQFNRNGITYLEQYTRDNADTVKGMPLCVEFLDNDKDVPYGHGLTGRIKNMPVFENSVQVGACDDWSIEDIEIEGEMHRCLCATGYVNEGRYPKFVKWLEEQIENGNTIRGSVEFVGTKENDGEIIYDGGWKEEGRIPMVYDYSGYCILSVKPSDPAAILIELNQFKDENLEVQIIMNEEIRKALDELQSNIVNAFEQTRVVETNEQVGTLEANVAELNSKIEELNSKITELNAIIEAKDQEIEKLNAEVSACGNKVLEKETELNSKIEELNSAITEKDAELTELKKNNKVAELNQALSSFTDEEKAYAKEDIEAFNADPFSVEINSIVTKIEAASYRKMREEQKTHIAETNNMKSEFDGIMSAIDPIVNDESTVEDFDCFA